MDFTGIIAEYDPFHNGHAAQLAAVRAAGAQCIAVCMSSGVVQRGGVPILPESVRVRAALESGEIEQTRYDSYVRLYELAKEIKEWELNP